MSVVDVPLWDRQEMWVFRVKTPLYDSALHRFSQRRRPVVHGARLDAPVSTSTAAQGADAKGAHSSDQVQQAAVGHQLVAMLDQGA